MFAVLIAALLFPASARAQSSGALKQLDEAAQSPQAAGQVLDASGPPSTVWIGNGDGTFRKGDFLAGDGRQVWVADPGGVPRSAFRPAPPEPSHKFEKGGTELGAYFGAGIGSILGPLAVAAVHPGVLVAVLAVLGAMAIGALAGGAIGKGIGWLIDRSHDPKKEPK